MRQYAISLMQVVFRFDTHTSAFLAWSIPGVKSRSVGGGIPVINKIICQRDTLKPESLLLLIELSVMCCHDLLKNLTLFGAKSSCKVQPLINHGTHPRSKRLVVSARCTMQILELWYQLNIDQIDSSSSVLLLLSIQPLSNQTYLQPYFDEMLKNLTSLTKF